MLLASVVGGVSVTDQNGRDYTPSGKKARALIALLLFSKNCKRSREWIQSMLWSDRGPEQSAGSLRQALSELRRSLDQHRDLLITRAGSVQLNSEFIKLKNDLGSIATTSDICEDLDSIKDAEFENWLRDLRQQYVVAPRKVEQRSNVPVLLISVAVQDNQAGARVVDLLRNEIVKSLLEFSDIRISEIGSGTHEAVTSPGPGVFLRISALVLNDKVTASIRLETLSGNWIVWQSPNEDFSIDVEEEAFWRLRCLSQTTVSRLQDEFERQSGDTRSGPFAQALANRAMRLLFRFGRQDLIDADSLLKSAYELDPRGVYLSWRAFIRNTAIFEHLTDSFLEPCEGYELHATALGDDPLNSYTLVFAGQHSFVNDRDPVFGQSLCDKALEINPSNAMGWAFRSNMLILQGEDEQAAQAAKRGLELASGQPCRSSLQINACLSGIAAGNYHEAVTYGRINQMSPTKCQAIRRFLFALFRALEMPVEAENQIAMIRTREPDFRTEDLLRTDYPTWTLQKMPIIESI